MSRFLKRLSQADNTINGCHIVPKSEATADFIFESHVVVLDEQNQMGIEFDKGRLRIDGVITTDEDSLKTMMDALATLAKRYGYSQLVFDDALEEGILAMFHQYGFREKEAIGDHVNHYLQYDLYQCQKRKCRR